MHVIVPKIRVGSFTWVGWPTSANLPVYHGRLMVLAMAAG